MGQTTLWLIVGHIVMYTILYGATYALPEWFDRYRFDDYSQL